MIDHIKTISGRHVLWLSGITLVLAASTSSAMEVDSSNGDRGIARAEFIDDTTVRLPDGYRDWTAVGLVIFPPGAPTILTGELVENNQIFLTYAEPTALAAYRASGEWPDGTQLLKEMTVNDFDTGGECNIETGFCSKTPHGMNISEARFFGIGYMVKDADRFPDAPGNWGYFGFGPVEGTPYPETAQLRPEAECASCHITHRADSDYVFSDEHIRLQE